MRAHGPPIKMHAQIFDLVSEQLYPEHNVPVKIVNATPSRQLQTIITPVDEYQPTNTSIKRRQITLVTTPNEDNLGLFAEILKKAGAHLSGNLDEEQIELYDLSFCEAQLRAAQALNRQAYGVDNPQHDLATTDTLKLAAGYFEAETKVDIATRLGRIPASYGLTAAEIPDLSCAGDALRPDVVRRLGEQFILQGIPQDKLDNEKAIIRDTFHTFSNDVVKPLAEEIHRQDLLVPDEILRPLKEMGCFGLSVPEKFGGLKPNDHEDSLGMVIVTEELSRGSLGAAGSLITRPEIMARAIMEGGTEEQKQRWLPGIAAGEPMCAISVTEPNTGSDVANVALKATRTEGGWLLNGGKTWCTFAGYAEYLLVLARTNPDISPPHKGLSLFVVEKPSSNDHDFEYQQPAGGKVTGRSIATLGYRGMHSYEMFYDNFFVPEENLIGGPAGEGKGFYFTMRGFMGGRLQTAARACGLMRAAFEAAASYAQDRKVFGKAVASYALSEAKFARIGAFICANKAFTNEVAQLMDEGEGATEASLVKLLACRSAEWVTREALQIHGGMGYAEESAVSRYFADARVLSIFEGAEETLAIRVVGKALAAG